MAHSPAPFLFLLILISCPPCFPPCLPAHLPAGGQPVQGDDQDWRAVPGHHRRVDGDRAGGAVWALQPLLQGRRRCVPPPFRRRISAALMHVCVSLSAFCSDGQVAVVAGNSMSSATTPNCAGLPTPIHPPYASLTPCPCPPTPCPAGNCPTLTNMLVIIVGGIPIAMPTVLSVTLALGAFVLAKEGAIVSRMSGEPARQWVGAGWACRWACAIAACTCSASLCGMGWAVTTLKQINRRAASAAPS